MVAQSRKATGFNEILPDEMDFNVFQDFVRTWLAHWLYRVTDIVTLQAKNLSSGKRFSHAELTALIDDAFLDRASDELPLRDGRNEVWNLFTLKSALNRVLPEIKTAGALTLSNVAKRINATRNQYPFVRNRKPLTAKHLQKLLKQHGIDWFEVKKAYICQLRAAENA